MTFRTFAILGIIAVIMAAWLSSMIFAALHHASPAQAMPWTAWQSLFTYGGSSLLFVALGLGHIIIAGIIGAIVIRPKPVYGDAHFASMRETKKAGLLAKDGVILGKKQGQYLMCNEAGHVLVTAPTRSGKGVGIVVPNLLCWNGSAIVLDIKQENYNITSGYRKKYGDKIILFSPMEDNGNTQRFNPLDTIRQDEAHRITDIQNLTTILLPVENSYDSMWKNEARDLFIGLVLYILDNPDVPHTIGEVHKMLKGDINLVTQLQKILSSALKTKMPIPSAAEKAFHNFINKAEKEQSGVRSTLTSALSLWQSPIIDKATSASDFSFNELRQKPTTIYIGASPSQLDTLAPLLNLFVQLAVNSLSRCLPDDKNNVPVLFLMDEFAALGRMDKLTSSMAYLAGYNVTFMNIIQGLGQLESLYHKAGMTTILQNSHIQVYFAANDSTTAEYVSSKLGTRTLKIKNRTTPRNSDILDRGSVSESLAQAPLMRPDEIRTLPKDKAIILKEGHTPVKATKIKYYEDKALKGRVE